MGIETQNFSPSLVQIASALALPFIRYGYRSVTESPVGILSTDNSWQIAQPSNDYDRRRLEEVKAVLSRGGRILEGNSQIAIAIAQYRGRPSNVCDLIERHIIAAGLFPIYDMEPGKLHARIFKLVSELEDEKREFSQTHPNLSMAIAENIMLMLLTNAGR